MLLESCNWSCADQNQLTCMVHGEVAGISNISTNYQQRRQICSKSTPVMVLILSVHSVNTGHYWYSGLYHILKLIVMWPSRAVAVHLSLLVASCTTITPVCDVIGPASCWSYTRLIAESQLKIYWKLFSLFCCLCVLQCHFSRCSWMSSCYCRPMQYCSASCQHETNWALSSAIELSLSVCWWYGTERLKFWGCTEMLESDIMSLCWRFGFGEISSCPWRSSCIPTAAQ